jgi:pectinesterase
MKKWLCIICFLGVGVLLYGSPTSDGHDASAAYKTVLYVAQDGSGDYTTIQAAINDTKAFPDQPITIHIRAGVYVEKVEVYAWNTHLTLLGEGSGNTTIQWGDHFEALALGRNSTFHTATLLVRGDNFRAENLTIENTAGPVGQAVALAIEADRCRIAHCRILGHQDTLYVDGANARQHFTDCYIAGTTDFIFGGATALFERCTLHSRSDSYITAASTPPGRPFGMVFLHCQLTADAGVAAVYLGRPWRGHAQVAFLHCDMGPHILAAGWHDWDLTDNQSTARFAEYNNTGAGGNRTGRVRWSQALTKRAAKKYSPAQVLAPFGLPIMKISKL